MPARKVSFSPDAVRQFRRLRAAERSRVKQAIKASLAEDDAATSSKNRFPLRRPLGSASFELRVGKIRLFYRVAGNEVEVMLIGRKEGNQLFIDDVRFWL